MKSFKLLQAVLYDTFSIEQSGILEYGEYSPGEKDYIEIMFGSDRYEKTSDLDGDYSLFYSYNAKEYRDAVIKSLCGECPDIIVDIDETTEVLIYKIEDV